MVVGERGVLLARIVAGTLGAGPARLALEFRLEEQRAAGDFRLLVAAAAVHSRSCRHPVRTALAVGRGLDLLQRLCPGVLRARGGQEQRATNSTRCLNAGWSGDTEPWKCPLKIRWTFFCRRS